MSEATLPTDALDLGGQAEVAWKALLAADRAFVASRETQSASLFHTALGVLQRRAREFHAAIDAFVESQDE